MLVPVSVPFGNISEYQTVPFGEFSFQVTRTADQSPLTSGTVTLEEGRAYTIVAAGEASIFVSSRLYLDS